MSNVIKDTTFKLLKLTAQRSALTDKFVFRASDAAACRRRQLKRKTDTSIRCTYVFMRPLGLMSVKIATPAQNLKLVSTRGDSCAAIPLTYSLDGMYSSTELESETDLNNIIASDKQPAGDVRRKLGFSNSLAKLPRK